MLKKRMQLPMRSFTLAPPAAASTLSPLLRMVSIQQHTQTHHAAFNQHIFRDNLKQFNTIFLFLPIVYIIKAGFMLSHWKLPQSLMSLGYHLRSHLTSGRSFPGVLIVAGVNLIQFKACSVLHRTNPSHAETY